MAELWPTLRREALHGKLAAIDPAQGAGRFAKIAEAIDAGAERWTAMRIEACRATRVDARQSEVLLDRRILCLDRWLDELADTVAIAERAGNRTEVDQAVRASTELSPLAACADVRALSEVLPLPTGASERAAAIEVASRINAIDVERRAGRIAELPSKIRDVVSAARKTAHDPTLAAALVAQARIDRAVRDYSDADATLRELAQVAARGRDDASAAFAWIQLIATLAEDRYKHPEANALIPTATAAVLRAGDPPDLRSDLLSAQSRLDLSPTRATALELLNRARALLEKSGATNPGSPLMGRLVDVMSLIAWQHSMGGDRGTAQAGYREVIERYRVLYGDDSPAEASVWLSLAGSFSNAGKHEESLPAYRRAVTIREARLGDTRTTALTHELFAMSLHMLGRWTEALESHDRAIRSYRANAQLGDFELVRTLGNRADTLAHLGRFDEAAQDLDEDLAVFEHDDNLKFDTTFDKAFALYNRGELQRRRGRCPDARRDFTRAADLAESVHENGLTVLIWALVGEGGCLLDERRFGDAIARLNRALKLKAPPDAAFSVILARVYLGRASVETRRDVAGGLAAVREARAALAAASDPTNADVVGDVDAWLAAHTR
jgi:tetratricopeptide (TPR) repeat protein